jgi:hypothetical protein
MTLPLERNPSTNAQNSISMSQVNVELFFAPNTPISLNQVTVRNLFQKPNDQALISLWDGFGKSNIGKPKNPQFTLVYQTTARVSWEESDGIRNKYTVTVKDAATDSIVYGPIQEFTTSPLQLFANLTGLTAGTSFKVHLLASNTAITPLPTAETIADLLTLENVPLTPTTPVVNVISKNILRVTASATYASSYDVYEVISGTDTLIVTGVQIPYDHNVLTYSLHTYKVKGRSTGGVGPMSAAAAPTRSLPDFPIAATAVSYGALTNITSSTVAVTWTKSASPVIISQRVRVLLQADGVEKYNSGLLGNTTVGNTSTSVLVANTVYNVYVDTNNEAGTAVSAVLSFTTKTVQPAAPSAVATSQTSITVTWGTTVGATSYVIYKGGASVGTKTSPFIDNTGITAYTAHSYQVAAVNAGGESVKSGTATETSWPEVPVNVTGVILTPDMNSISISWTKAVTTPTRTVDNYRVYAYLTSDMSQVFDSGLLANSIISTVTNTNLIGWTGYTIRIYTYNRAGNIYVDNTITTLPDLKPDPITSAFVSVTNQELGTTNVAGSSVTIGTFTPGYSTGGGVTVSASNGSFQTGTLSLTTGWVTTATVIPDSSGNIVFQPRMNASPNETNTVTSTFIIGAGSRTFSVTTRDPNPPSNPSAVGGTGIATISWTYNSLYTYTVTADTGQTKTGITSGSVVLGDLSANNSRLSGTRTFSIYAKNVYNGISSAATTSAYVTPMPLFTYTRSGATVTETAGSNTGSFGISTTNVATNTSYNWSITGVSAADFSAMSYTSTGGTVVSMTPALTGSFIVNSGVATVSFTIATDHLTESTPETMSFQLTGSPTGDFATSNTTMSITDTSLDPDLIPTPRVGDLPVRFNCDLNSVQETSVLVRGVEPSWTTIPVSCLSGTIFATGMAGYATSGNATSNGSGEFTLYLRRTASGSYKTAVSMEFSVGGTTQGGWTIVTTPDEVISVTPGTRTITDGAAITYTISGANEFDGYNLDVIEATGTIVNTNSIVNEFLSATGTVTKSIYREGFGTYRLRATFNSSGHTRYSETVTQNADIYPDTFAVIEVANSGNLEPYAQLYPASQMISGMSKNCPITISWSFTNFVAFSGMSVTGATSVSEYTNSSLTVNTDSTGSVALAFGIRMPNAFSTTCTASITVGSRTLNPAFTATTRAADIYPTLPLASWDNSTDYSIPINSTVSAAAAYVTDLEHNYSINVSSSGGSFFAGTYTTVGTPLSTSATVTTSPSGSFVMQLVLQTSNSYNTVTSMTYTVGSRTETYSVRTTANEVFTVSPSSMSVGSTATLNITGAIANSTVTLQTVNSNGNITDVVFLSGLLVNSNGSASTVYMVGARGTCQFMATFSATGHTRTTGTLTVYPIPAVSISFNITTREMAVSITNAWPTDTFNIVGTGTGNMSGLNSPSPMTILNNGTSTAYYMGTSNAVWGTWWGTWYCTVTSSLSAYTATSNTVIVPKLAPNVTPAIGTVTAQNGSISFPYTLGASTAGPVEFVASVMNGGTPGSNANISSGTFTYIGLTNGTQYLFSVYAGNSTANGSASVFSATPVLTAPVVTVTLSYIASGLGFIDFGFTVGTNTGGPWSNYAIWTTPNPGDLTTTWISASPPYSGRLSGTINWSTPYSIYIAVSNAAGYSASSNTITVTPTPDTTPTPIPTIPANATGQPIGGVMADSGTFTVYGLQPNYNSLTISASGGVIGAGNSNFTLKYAQDSSRSDISTDPSGNLLVVLRLPTSYSPLTTTNMTFTIGTFLGSWSATTVNVAPGEVTVTLVSKTSTSISISWSYAAGGGVVTLIYASASNSTYGNILANPFPMAGTVTTYTFNGCTPGASYIVTVGAYNNVGNSTKSITVVTDLPTFAPPTPFTGTSTYATQILTFTYTATHTRTYTVTATGFDCRLSLNNSAYQDNDEATGNGETSTILLTAGASLTIKVTGASGGAFAKFGTITVTIT